MKTKKMQSMENRKLSRNVYLKKVLSVVRQKVISQTNITVLVCKICRLLKLGVFKNSVLWKEYADGETRTTNNSDILARHET